MKNTDPERLINYLEANEENFNLKEFWTAFVKVEVSEFSEFISLDPHRKLMGNMWAEKLSEVDEKDMKKCTRATEEGMIDSDCDQPGVGVLCEYDLTLEHDLILRAIPGN